MAEIKGSKTEQNLRTAFAGESQAHTKYLYYASKAEKEGYRQIGALFRETALNEKEQLANLHVPFLGGPGRVVQVLGVGLGFTGKSGPQVFFGF